MLHKSFKPAKCKTSLKLAASRIKLLKNKKEVQVRQIKGELAKLLEAGQDQTARIRVEHFVREEKSKEAYELIEIFCELIAARLPMIESQKTCPVDLKEAVSSVIFASPRCADIPELLDVRKHFKAKYGKEFVLAAVELRPECGVNRMLVEKLSAKAPDGQNKLKILSAIAKEYNIKWDPESFGDSSSNPPADLLNGPNTFEKASRIQIQMEPIGVQPSANHNNKGSPSVPVSFKSDERHNVPENSPQHNFGPTLNSQSKKSDLINTNTNRINITGHQISETRSSETNEEGVRFRHSSFGNQNNYSSGRQHWSMDFKDATSAAQAAAESAERASLAARAAAELSSRGIISWQSSFEGQKSSPSNIRAEGPREYASSIFLTKDQVASPHRSSMMNDNWIDNDAKRFVGNNAEKSYDPSLMKSSPGTLRAERPQEYASSNFLHKDQVASPSHRGSMTNANYTENDAKGFVGNNADESYDPYLVKSSPSTLRAKGPKEYASSNLQHQLPKDQVTSATHRSSMMDDNWIDNDAKRFVEKNAELSCDPYPRVDDYHGSASTEEQPRNSDVQYVSDQPHSKGSGKFSSSGEVRLGNDLNREPSQEILENDTDVNPFATGNTNNYGDTIETSFNDDTSVVFDDYGPDDDFELDNYQKKESILELPSPGEKISINLSEATDPWIPKQSQYESPEKSVSHARIFEEHTSLYAENPKSSGDPFQSDDLLPATFDHSDGPSSESEEETTESEIADKKNNGEGKRHSHVLVESSEEKRGAISPRSSSKSSLAHEAKGKGSPPSTPDIIQETLVFEESTSENYSALSFGKLRGGLRNKMGYKRPPSIQAGENYASKIEQSTSISSSTGRGSFRSNASSQETDFQNVEDRRGEEKSSRAKSNSFYSYLDDPKDKFSDSTLRSDQESYSDEVDIKISKKSTSRVADKYPGFHDDDDPEEYLPRQNMNDSPRQAIEFSRRTKASPISSNSYLKDSYLKDSYETPKTRDDESERKASRNYHASTASLKMKAQTRYSDHLEYSEQPQSSKPFKKTPETKKSFHDERLRSSTKEQSLKMKTRTSYSDHLEDSEQPQSITFKKNPETKRSITEERLRRSTKEQLSNAPLDLETQSSSESLKFSYSRERTAAPLKTKAQINNSDHIANSEQPRSTKPSKQITEPQRSYHEERLTSSTEELPSTSSPKLETQRNSETLKREKSTAGEKASHVHPNLPDYDDFTAHFLSLRQNRK